MEFNDGTDVKQQMYIDLYENAEENKDEDDDLFKSVVLDDLLNETKSFYRTSKFQHEPEAKEDRNEEFLSFYE